MTVANADEPQVDRSQVHAEATLWLKDNWDPDLSVRAWWAKLADSGWGFPTWPKEWFGRGLGAEMAAAVRDAFVEVGALAPAGGLGQRLGGPTILTHATDEQKAQFMRGLATGEENWCQFFSEPGSGSDLASAQTRAVRDGDNFIVNGQKVWTSGAQWSDRGMLVSRTDVDVPKHRGITYFIIDLDQPGIEVRPLHQMNDEHGFNEVFFTDAVVSADRIITEENAGWAVAVTTLMFERFMGGLPSAMPGKKGGQLDKRAGDVVEQLSGRRRSFLVDGLAPVLQSMTREQGTNTNPLVKQRLADLHIIEEVDRMAAMQQTDAVRAGQRPSSAGSLRKLYRSHLAKSRADVGMATLGASGMLVGEDTPSDGQIQKLALSAPSSSIAGGSDEIQKGIVGERVLGFPKEPSIDREVPFKELKIGTRRGA